MSAEKAANLIRKKPNKGNSGTFVPRFPREMTILFCLTEPLLCHRDVSFRTKLFHFIHLLSLILSLCSQWLCLITFLPSNILNLSDASICLFTRGGRKENSERSI